MTLFKVDINNISNKMHEGCIAWLQVQFKWFNNAKGFGFICPEGEEGDIFAHYSTIQMEGYRTLKAGQQVDYEVESGRKAHTQAP